MVTLPHRRRVLVTRAPHQASFLSGALEARGMEPVLVPTIEMAPPPSFERLDQAIREILPGQGPAAGGAASFDWVVFTSVNAFQALKNRLQDIAGNEDIARVMDAAGIRVAAVGPATSSMLERAGLRVEVVGAVPTAESLAKSLLCFVRRTDGTPARFFVPQSEQGLDHLPEILARAGADVFLATAYRMVGPEGTPAALRELFGPGGHPPDAVTFTSSSSATHLAEMMKAAGVELPEAVLRASIGPTTTQTLKDLGLPPHVQAATATVESLADAVAFKFGLRNTL